MTEGTAYDGVPQELVMRLVLRKLVPFLGAGCSVAEPSRMPAAKGVAQMLIDRGAGTEGQSLEDIAEEAWARGGWQEFAQLLPIDEWRTRPPNVITRVVGELCKETLIAQILTTNWDLLIESALSQIGQPYAKVVDAHTLAIEPAGTVTLIKLNGCIDHPGFIKATRTQIEAPDWLDAWIDAVFDVLVRTSSLLFAGYSGASRAATTTIAKLVEAGERHAADFVVDRQTPDAIAESSESGSRFINAINLASPITGEASDFFARLRAAVYPLLLAQPATCARAMASELVAPTTVAAEDLNEEIGRIVDVFKATDAAACQRWLSTCFRSFPDFDHVDPYLPLLPNASDVGKCQLLLAATRWAERLDAASELDFTLTGVPDEVRTELPCQIVVCHARQRLDAAARAAVVAFAREHPSPAAIGIAFGGIGDVEPVTSSFSVVRGSRVHNAARASGASIGWIDGEHFWRRSPQVQTQRPCRRASGAIWTTLQHEL